MSMQKLKKQIQLIKPTEFEELTAILLTSFLKQPFIVARKGDQPSGDARNLDGDISIQAKRYSDENTPNAKLVEGDIRQANRSLPHLQVYVLALSRDKAQLQDTLDSIAEETGLDIIVLELTDEISDIETLCVVFWEDICHFFDLLNTDHDFLDWVEEMKNDTETEKKLKTLKQKLENGIQSQYHVKKDVEKFLLDRFSRDEGYNPINLSKAIVRQQIESELKNWWVNDDVPICYLQGEEGTGKTWLAAKWIYSIQENEKIVVLWLDSKNWNGCKSIFDLLKNCLYAIYGSDEQEKILKLQKKISKIWNKTLIVLDGANEREAIAASQAILSEYFQSKSEWRDKIRFLFTTRSLEKYPNYESYIWKKCKKLLVNSFNDSEFQKALSVIGMQNDDIPTSLKEIAIIPRYFNTCIRLRDKFGSIGNVTKELVLWIDLLEKIDGTDPQIKKNLGWHRTKDALEVLSVLAKQANWKTDDSNPQISVQQIQASIPNYHDVRHDLEEQRIAVDAGIHEVQLSKNHVVLGWALLLSSVYDIKKYSTIQEFIVETLKILEPIPSEDLRTEAMFVVLDIVESPQTQDISDNELTLKRSYFMYAWYNSNNADITEDRISHCVENYTDAYAQFVEFEFKKDILPNEEYTLIEPLAIIWKNKKGQLNHLEARLTKWLLPTYTDEYKNSNDNIDPTIRPSPNLHFAQNLLASAALSILSQSPELNFLPTIAQCYVIHKENPQFNQNIGRLMRWGFTEDIIDDLNSLAEEIQTDETLLTGVQSLAEELKLVEIPEPLQRQLSEEDTKRREFAEDWNKTHKPYIDCIRTQEKLLKDDSPDVNVKGNYQGLDYLAVRTDLPDLIDDDLVKIKDVLNYILGSSELVKSAFATLEDYCIGNLMPWFAKYNPQNYSEFVCNIMIKYLSAEHPTYLLRLFQGMFHLQDDCRRITDTILEVKECLTQNNEFSLERICIFTEILLFNASKDKLILWFEFLAQHAPLRISICFTSVSQLLRKLLPKSISELAMEKLKTLQSSIPTEELYSDTEQENLSEFEYWSALYAYGTQVNEDVVTWAFEELRLRNPDSNATYPILKITLTNSKRFLDEILTDENIREHLICKESIKLILSIYEGNDVPSYEDLVSILPIEIVGSFLCQSERQEDLSNWGRDLMKRMISIQQGNERYLNSIEETRFTFNRQAIQTWANQNEEDFLQLSNEYLTGLAKSPKYREILSDFTNVILCLLLGYQPQKALHFYLHWARDTCRIVFNTYYNVPVFIAHLWKAERYNKTNHQEIRRELLEESLNDEDIMFMTIAALAEGGTTELWNLVTQKYLKSLNAKERNLGVAILPWFGTNHAIELLEDLKSNDPSLWVRNHAAWGYEVAHQERSCRKVYGKALRRALTAGDMSRISAAFEQMKPALSPSAKYWHYKIEEEIGLYEQSQDNIPKLLALIERFWISWGNNSKTRQNIKIYGRKLKEYCRGEKLGFGSPPRLAPWWKPEK